MEQAALEHNPRLTLKGSRPLDEEIDAWAERKGTLPNPEDVLKEEYTRGDRNWSCAA